jgi:hypothetical protein
MTPQLFILPVPVPPPTPEAIHNAVMGLLRHSAFRCEAVLIPERLGSVGTLAQTSLDVIAEKLHGLAEHVEVEGTTTIFLGELPNGYPWQVRVRCSSK